MSDDPHQALPEHLPALLRFARSLTRDVSAADDLVQDVVVRALERRHRFDGQRSYRSWLLALTHNLFVDGWRRARVRQNAQSELQSRATDGMEPSQEHATDLRAALRNFEALPVDQRAVMHLVVVGGASYAETADILGIPVGTVMSRLSRARETLRRAPETPGAPHLKLVSNRDA